MPLGLNPGNEELGVNNIPNHAVVKLKNDLNLIKPQKTLMFEMKQHAKNTI